MKRMVSMLLVLVCIFACMGSMQASAASGQEIVNDLINNYVGKYSYVLNTHGPKTFDCTGLVYYVYKQHGVTLPYTTKDDWTKCGTVIKDRSKLQSGDVLLFGSSETSLKHAGIYDSNGGYIIHALNENYDIIRKPTLSEWVSSASWNSQGSNQFQYAVRIFGSNVLTPPQPTPPPSTNKKPSGISDPNRVLRYKELHNVYDKTTEELQECLNYIMNAGLTVDGKYGIKTHDAVKEFQRKYGLKVDGDAGPQTLGKINEILKKDAPHTHTYSGTNHEAAHPHREYKKCTCGHTEFTGKNVTVNDCAQCTTPGKPVLLNMQESYTEGTEVKFTWEPTVNTTHYNLYISRQDENGDYAYYENVFYAESGMTRTFEPGKYKVFLQPTNANAWTDDKSTWRFTDSDMYYFEVLAKHTHKFKKSYETEHPHTQYEICECGEIRYTGGTKKMSGCKECYPPVQKKILKLQIGVPTMYVNDVSQALDPGRNTVPIIQNDRTLLPIRMIVEAFGASVIWDEIENKVTIDAGSTVMKFWIDSTRAVVNEQVFTIDVAPVILNDRTFMPLRFIAEQMGLTVGWNETNRTITVEGSL